MDRRMDDLVRVEQDLQRAIDTLYQTFAGYPLRDEIKGCTYCVPPADQARLRSIPLRALTAQDLYRFMHSNCALTWGEAVELKHFLPRLCELIALDISMDGHELTPEILGRGLQFHGYPTWPPAERRAVASFFQAWWRQVLSAMPSGLYELNQQAETVLCTLGQFTDDLAPTLAIWQQTPTLPSLAHLIVLVNTWVVDPNLPPTTELVWDEEAWWEDDFVAQYGSPRPTHKRPYTIFPYSLFWRGWEQQLAQAVEWVNAPTTARWALELNEHLRTSEPATYQQWRETTGDYLIEDVLAWFELLGSRSPA